MMSMTSAADTDIVGYKARIGERQESATQNGSHPIVITFDCNATIQILDLIGVTGLSEELTRSRGLLAIYSILKLVLY